MVCVDVSVSVGVDVCDVVVVCVVVLVLLVVGVVDCVLVILVVCVVVVVSVVVIDVEVVKDVVGVVVADVLAVVVRVELPVVVSVVIRQSPSSPESRAVVALFNAAASSVHSSLFATMNEPKQLRLSVRTSVASPSLIPSSTAFIPDNVCEHVAMSLKKLSFLKMVHSISPGFAPSEHLSTRSLRNLAC